ncbi:hypothetical protein BDW68DRAFT_25946 [Aspergillus falconensis]
MAVVEKAARCARLLEQICQTESSDVLRQEWENQIFRFNLWSSNNFVFAPTRASMDWRLRNAPTVESAICELLDDLQSGLIRHEAIIKIKGTPEDTSPHDAVNETLEELFRLSRAVRRSGVLRRFVKIGSYVEYDGGGVNLTEEFRKGVERIVDFRLRGSRSSAELKQRVVDTVCLRQQHFAYLRAKWEKGKVTSTINTVTPQLPRSTLGATFSVTGSMSSGVAKRKQTAPVAAIQAHSVMTATTAQAGRIKQVRFLKSTPSVDEVKVEYNPNDLPIPPKIPANTVEYECPFCYMVCPSVNYVGERWKKHVTQDLMPYICVLDNCPTPQALYESAHDWIKHMKTQHVVSAWTCMDEGHETTLTFRTDLDFKTHMQTCHIGAFAEEELDDIVSASYQRRPEESVLTDCPFCPTYEDGNVPPESVISHIVEHLFAFARISLPWQHDGETMGSYSSNGGLSSSESDAAPLSVFRRQRLRRLGSRTRRSKDYWKQSQGSFDERPDEDSFDLYAGGPTKEEPYTIERESLPDVDKEMCDSLWKNVRQVLKLPPLDHQPPQSLLAFQVQEQEDDKSKKNFGEQESDNIHTRQVISSDTDEAGRDLQHMNAMDPIPIDEVILRPQSAPDGIASADYQSAGLVPQEDDRQKRKFTSEEPHPDHSPTFQRKPLLSAYQRRNLDTLHASASAVWPRWESTEGRGNATTSD